MLPAQRAGIFEVWSRLTEEGPVGKNGNGIVKSPDGGFVWRGPLVNKKGRNSDR